MKYCEIDTKYDKGVVKITYRTDEVPESAVSVSLTVHIPELGETQSADAKVDSAKSMVSLDILYNLDKCPECWDEFSLKLYEMDLKLTFLSGDEIIDEKTFTKIIGFCEVGTLGTQFIINRHTTFIRAIEICPDTVTLFDENDWKGYLTELKERGLNCVSVHTSLFDEALLFAADKCGIYVKAHVKNECGCEMEEAPDVNAIIARFGYHPSLIMLRTESEDMTKGETHAWAEFAVRDRQDYSDAPDTKSNHIEDIRNQDRPTLVTNVGELRNKVDYMTPGFSYLAQICTREAMEEAIRTPKFGGFCLHSDAAVMSLPKRRMCEFSGCVVPLLLMKKYVWSSDETFTADMMVANYGKEKFFERVSVSAYDEHGQHYAVTSNKIRMNSGNVLNVGKLTIPLNQFSPGQRLELTISIGNTLYRNHYAIWMFDDNISVKVPPHVHVTRKLDARTTELIENGKKVVYIPHLNRIKGEPGWFSPLASEISSNREVVVSGGISCDYNHPALEGFPTEEMADFQWWNLLHNCTPVKLSGNLQSAAIVSMPPETKGDQSKAIIFEAHIGQGRILVCTIDLLIQLDRPEARQLYASLLSYAASDRFNPAFDMELSELKEITCYLH